MKSVILLVLSAVMAQEPVPLPPTESAPSEQPAPAPDGAKEDDRAKPKKKVKRRRKKVAEKPAEPATPTKPKRSRIKPQPRVEPGDFTTLFRPLTVGERAMLTVAQTGCGVLGTGATLAGAGGTALLARTLDRPAGGLLHPPVPVGGLMPIFTTAVVGGLTTAVCVVGLGAMAERRALGVASAGGAWAMVAIPTVALALAAVFTPLQASSRNTALRENTTAAALVTLGVLGPIVALAAYQGGAYVQQERDATAYEESRQAAREAAREDAAKKKAAPKPVAEPK
ncbi:MAG: hypothetical protein AB2A00_42120, partial [Myxococcota bacterium]